MNTEREREREGGGLSRSDGGLSRDTDMLASRVPDMEQEPG